MRRALWLGVAATALIGLGVCQPGFAPGGSWRQPVVDGIGLWLPTPVAEILVVLGVIGLCLAWWWAKELPRTQLFWLVGLWSLPLLLAPPTLSADVTLYADTGWIILSGGNPYFDLLGSLGGPFAANIDPLWAGHGVAYPPLTLLVNAGAVWLAGAHPYWTFVVLRLPALVGVALAAWSLPRLAERLGVPVAGAVWLGIANPLVIVHLVGGAHNDALMLGVCLLAAVVALRRWWLGALLVGVAMALKQQAGLMVLAVAGLSLVEELSGWSGIAALRRLAGRLTAATALTIGVFGGLSWATLGTGWTHWLGEMGRTGTPAPFSILSQLSALVGLWFGFDYHGLTRGLALASTLAVVVALAVIVLKFANRPLAAVGWGATALAVLGQALHPWYLPWGIACLAATPLTRRQRMIQVAIIMGFVVWNSIQTVIWHSMPEWYVP